MWMWQPLSSPRVGLKPSWWSLPVHPLMQPARRSQLSDTDADTDAVALEAKRYAILTSIQ